ncbi:septum site-determining protein MinC, partial [Stenotrophomonas lactitubi]|uniref:septum site-determining protein MinC n=1 Tax=Stenotrophomonas lactitubi TaxID=2045214 RepID=UPI0033423A04
MDTRPAAAGAGTAADGDLSVAVNFDYEQAGELKIGQVGIANLRIRTLDVERLVQEMQERVSRAPKLFGRAAVILDFGGLSQVPDVSTAQALVDGLRGAGVLPVALAYGTSAVDLLSQQLGLPLLAKFRAQYERAEAEPAPPPAPTPEPRRAARAEAKAAPAAAPATPMGKAADAAAPQPGRMQLGNVRSGQQLYAENCDLTVMATVGAGAEVIA